MPFSIKRVLVDERNRPFCLVSGIRSSASPSHPAVWPYGLNHEEGTASIRQMFLMPTGGATTSGTTSFAVSGPLPSWLVESLPQQ